MSKPKYFVPKKNYNYLTGWGDDKTLGIKRATARRKSSDCVDIPIHLAGQRTMSNMSFTQLSFDDVF
jgi:hypothetical protein